MRLRAINPRTEFLRDQSRLQGGLVVGFCILSAVAVLRGVQDLILAEEAQFSLLHIFTFATVILLTAAMWKALDLAAAPGPILRRLVMALLYLFLLLWSVAFGYGFWWNMIAARSETRAHIEASMLDVQTQIEAAANAVKRVEGLLGGVISTADAKQQDEIQFGSSCGVGSPPGDGTLAKRRKRVTNEVAKLKEDLGTSWIAPLQMVLSGDGQAIGGLQAEQAKLSSQNMRSLNLDQRRTVYDSVRDASRTALGSITTINAAQGQSFATRFENLAGRLEMLPMDRFSNCYDPELAAALRTAAKGAREMPIFVIPKFDILEGPAATRAAFDRIWSNMAWLLSKLSGAAGVSQQVERPAPLTQFEEIALIASIGVDLCILLFALTRPRRPLEGLDAVRIADEGSRAKLDAVFRSFAEDDKLDPRRILGIAIMYTEHHSYLILPNLSARMAPSWRSGSLFLSHIMLAMRAMRAIDRSFRPMGVVAALRSRLTDERRLFDMAVRQLTENGWHQDAEQKQPLRPKDLSLHRFRDRDLLEIQLAIRANSSVAGVSTAPAASAISSDANADDRRRTGLMGSFGSIARGIFARGSDTVRSPRATDTQDPTPMGVRPNGPFQHDSDFFRFSEYVREFGWLPPSEAPGSDKIGAGKDRIELGQMIADIDTMLEQAQEAAKEEPDRTEDVQALHSAIVHLMETFETAGVVPTTNVGDAFDANFHEPSVVEDSAEPANSILRVVSQGYKEKSTGQVLRKAGVVVSSGEQGPRAAARGANR